MIATSVEVGASNVDTRGVGIGSRVARVASTVDVVRATVARSEVAVFVRLLPVAVHPLTRAGVVRQ